jgi:hypothetical protein
MEGAQVFGVITGTPEAPRVAYLQGDATVDLAATPALGGLQPGHVFRIAATCETSRCQHFDGSRCMLAKRIASQLPTVVDVLPRCRIRSSCRWFAEQGGEACLRCPQVVTLASEDMPDLVGVAATATP